MTEKGDRRTGHKKPYDDYRSAIWLGVLSGVALELLKVIGD